jgi:hypothetical protein
MFNGCQFAGAQKAPAGNFNSVAISAGNSQCKHEIMVQKLWKGLNNRLGKVINTGLNIFDIFMGKRLTRIAHGKYVNGKTELFQ